MQGRIQKLMPSYGFIETAGNVRGMFFPASSCRQGVFDGLHVGDVLDYVVADDGTGRPFAKDCEVVEQATDTTREEMKQEQVARTIAARHAAHDAARHGR